MTRHVGDPGALLASTVTMAAALGFVRVAAHFDLFSVLVKIGPTANAEAITKASDEQRSDRERQISPLCIRLTQDTMFAMASLGFVDLVDSETGTYRANAITNHIDATPSAIHGMIHFTTEPLFGAAFLMRKLVDTNFKYPFDENNAPFQYGFELLGKDEYMNKNFYEIIYMEGRMPSFDQFMEGKFGKSGTMPERVHKLGYDLSAALKGTPDEVVLVDIGGGRGEMLLEAKEAFPALTKKNLVLQEFTPSRNQAEEVTFVQWNFKTDAPQPVTGAKVYSLTHIYHNMPDLEALQLMQKIAKAMKSNSRMLIHEFSKNSNYGKMHAAMIVQFSGRIRSSREWHQMASLCGLKVTFEAYPEIGEGLVEVMKSGP